MSARDLLADRSRWSPVHIATDVDGRWVPVGDNNAVRFNLQGAVIRAAGRRARDAMKAAESALRTCSSEAFARTLVSPRAMTHTEALAWLHGAVSALAAQVVSEQPPTSRSGVSGLMLRVTEADAISRKTTGTGGDDE
ncbi:MAG TPA: hypothetical protein VHC69_30585 [Polyangiaceae bacterium]|nr:hypothetical protein [Polyangiaceae bacterium]